MKDLALFQSIREKNYTERVFNTFTDLFECIFEEQHQQLKNWEMGAVFKSSQVYTHKKSQELCKFIQVTEIKRVRQTS